MLSTALRRSLNCATIVAVFALLVALTTLGARASAAQVAGGGLSIVAWDSVRTGLASSDWNERHAALLRVNGAYPDALPIEITEPLLALLTREAAVSGANEGNEDFGEYIVDLVLTGVRTRDPRTIPAILALDGLGISSGVAAFVASQGPSMIPTLDAHGRTRDDRASDVVETYALMYARYGSLLARTDSVQLLRRLVAAASDTSSIVRSQVMQITARVPLPELRPIVADLATTDPRQANGIFYVRENAVAALPVVTRALSESTPTDLVAHLELLTDAACDGAVGELRGLCTSMAAHLATAARFVEARQARPAANALDAYAQIAERAGSARLVPRLTAVTLGGTARAVIDRL